MFSKGLITGDTHGIFSRFKSLKKDPETAIIILGDVGFNYTLDEHDTQAKKAFCKRFPFTVYCVKGNHEARPASVEGMTLVYDENVDGEVTVYALGSKPTSDYTMQATITETVIV